MDDKEREEIEDLRTIVHGMDRIVKKLAKKYLKDAPRGRLHIESFFDLILLKVRKIARDKALETLLSDEIQKRINLVVRSHVGDNLRKMVYLPVLIRRAHRKEVSLKKYRAYCLRGNVPKSVPAETTEEAYSSLRDAISTHFARTTDDIGICKMDLMEEFDTAQYLMEDIVEGFRVIVKVSKIEPEEETDAG